MGSYLGCGQCGSLVYTSGDRMPQHDTPEGKRCPNRHTTTEPDAYYEGFDGDFWVMQGGLWERNRNRF